jgi:hypothetical protein
MLMQLAALRRELPVAGGELADLHAQDAFAFDEAAERRTPVLRLLETILVAGDFRERPLLHDRIVVGVQEKPAVRHALERAKARLDRLTLYPAPVRIDRVRVHVWPLLFGLPWFRRFDGYAAWNTILLREPVERAGADLICHELCHVWQMQHRPLAMPLSYLRSGYERNRYEEEACAAVAATAAE